MLTSDRDRQIVHTVARFRQLTSGQIAELHFHELASSTPLYRVLNRLVADNYLARIELPRRGGTRGGSGQSIYQLGSAGWRELGREKRYTPLRAVSSHMLAVADAHIELVQLERLKLIEILGYETEPHSWTVIEGVRLFPDLFEDIAIHFKGEKYACFIEVDMGTERKSKIMEKVDAYKEVARRTGVDPFVIFVAVDDHRARELRWFLSTEDKAVQDWIIVSTISEYARLIFT